MTKCDPLCSWIFRMVKVVHPYQTLRESILTSRDIRASALERIAEAKQFSQDGKLVWQKANLLHKKNVFWKIK